MAYWQLGEHTGEDKCCREHDNCPSFLAAGQCLGDVCNTSPFTRYERSHNNAVFHLCAQQLVELQNHYKVIGLHNNLDNCRNLLFSELLLGHVDCCETHENSWLISMYPNKM